MYTQQLKQDNLSSPKIVRQRANSAKNNYPSQGRSRAQKMAKSLNQPIKNLIDEVIEEVKPSKSSHDKTGVSQKTLRGFSPQRNKFQSEKRSRQNVASKTQNLGSNYMKVWASSKNASDNAQNVKQWANNFQPTILEKKLSSKSRSRSRSKSQNRDKIFSAFGRAVLDLDKQNSSPQNLLKQKKQRPLSAHVGSKSRMKGNMLLSQEVMHGLKNPLEDKVQIQPGTETCNSPSKSSTNISKKLLASKKNQQFFMDRRKSQQPSSSSKSQVTSKQFQTRNMPKVTMTQINTKNYVKSLHENGLVREYHQEKNNTLTTPNQQPQKKVLPKKQTLSQNKESRNSLVAQRKSLRDIPKLPKPTYATRKPQSRMLTSTQKLLLPKEKSPVVKMARNSQVVIRSLNTKNKSNELNQTQNVKKKASGKLMSIEGSELMQLIDQGFNEIQQHDQQVQQINRESTLRTLENDNDVNRKQMASRGELASNMTLKQSEMLFHKGDINDIYFQEMVKQHEIQQDNKKLQKESQRLQKSLAPYLRSQSGSIQNFSKNTSRKNFERADVSKLRDDILSEQRKKTKRQRPSTANIKKKDKIVFDQIDESLNQFKIGNKGTHENNAGDEEDILVKYDSSVNTMNVMNSLQNVKDQEVGDYGNRREASPLSRRESQQFQIHDQQIVQSGTIQSVQREGQRKQKRPRSALPGGTKKEYRDCNFDEQFDQKSEEDGNDGQPQAFSNGSVQKRSGVVDQLQESNHSEIGPPLEDAYSSQNQLSQEGLDQTPIPIEDALAKSSQHILKIESIQEESSNNEMSHIKNIGMALEYNRVADSNPIFSDDSVKASPIKNTDFMTRKSRNLVPVKQSAQRISIKSDSSKSLSLNRRVQQRLRSQTPTDQISDKKVNFENTLSLNNQQHIRQNEQKISSTYKKRLDKIRDSFDQDPISKSKQTSQKIKFRKIILNSKNMSSQSDVRTPKREDNQSKIQNILIDLERVNQDLVPGLESEDGRLEKMPQLSTEQKNESVKMRQSFDSQQMQEMKNQTPQFLISQPLKVDGPSHDRQHIIPQIEIPESSNHSEFSSQKQPCQTNAQAPILPPKPPNFQKKQSTQKMNKRYSQKALSSKQVAQESDGRQSKLMMESQLNSSFKQSDKSFQQQQQSSQHFQSQHKSSFRQEETVNIVIQNQPKFTDRSSQMSKRSRKSFKSTGGSSVKLKDGIFMPGDLIGEDQGSKRSGRSSAKDKVSEFNNEINNQDQRVSLIMVEDKNQETRGNQIPHQNLLEAFQTESQDILKESKKCKPIAEIEFEQNKEKQLKSNESQISDSFEIPQYDDKSQPDDNRITEELFLRAVKKIQSLWRKKKFYTLIMARTTCKPHNIGDEENDHLMIQNIGKIESELRYLTNRGPNSEHLKKIMKIQQIWRIRSQVRKYRSQLPSQKYLYKTVREFFEDPDDPVPSNFTITVYPNKNTTNQKPCLDIMLKCNNFERKRLNLSIEMPYEIKQTSIQELLSFKNNQSMFIQDLIDCRLFFNRYPQIITKSNKKLLKQYPDMFPKDKPLIQMFGKFEFKKFQGIQNINPQTIQTVSQNEGGQFSERTQFSSLNTETQDSEIKEQPQVLLPGYPRKNKLIFDQVMDILDEEYQQIKYQVQAKVYFDAKKIVIKAKNQESKKVQSLVFADKFLAFKSDQQIEKQLTPILFQLQFDSETQKLVVK